MRMLLSIFTLIGLHYKAKIVLCWSQHRFCFKKCVRIESSVEKPDREKKPYFLSVLILAVMGEDYRTYDDQYQNIIWAK